VAELLSRRLLRAFEDVCAGFGTLRTIENAFGDEDFDTSVAREEGTRRDVFITIAATVDLTDQRQTTRLLRVLETIASWVPRDDVSGPNPAFEQLRAALERDGYRIDDTGRIHAPNRRTLVELPLEHLRDPSAILEHLERLERVGGDDPAMTISSAKAIIEATTKHVLDELGEDYDGWRPILGVTATRA
jgi:hypothetical protein